MSARLWELADKLKAHLAVVHTTAADIASAVATHAATTLGSGGTHPRQANIVNAEIDNAAAIAESKLNLASDAAAGTASRRTLGTGATQAAAGNHGHADKANLSGATFTGQVNADGKLRIGAGGTAYITDVVQDHTLNPASVPANTTATWTFNPTVGTPAVDVSVGTWAVIPLLGLHGQGSIFGVTPEINGVGLIEWIVRNVTTGAVDLGSRTFRFRLVRIA